MKSNKVPPNMWILIIKLLLSDLPECEEKEKVIVDLLDYLLFTQLMLAVMTSNLFNRRESSLLVRICFQYGRMDPIKGMTLNPSFDKKILRDPHFVPKDGVGRTVFHLVCQRLDQKMTPVEEYDEVVNFMTDNFHREEKIVSQVDDEGKTPIESWKERFPTSSYQKLVWYFDSK